MQEEEMPKKSVRGPDKQPRAKRGPSKKTLPPGDVMKSKLITLSDNEDEFLKEKYGDRTTAIRTLLPAKFKKIKRIHSKYNKKDYP